MHQSIYFGLESVVKKATNNTVYYKDV